MDQSLKGAIALVTGAAGGIGRAICAQMQKSGAIIVATDLADANLDIACELYLQHDVADPARWSAIAQEIEQRYGKLDCLVNNAGYSIVESIEGTSLDSWRKVQAINVESILHSLQVFTSMLRKAGETRPGGSSVVNLSSVGGLRGAAFNAAYCTSKGAVKLFTKSAAIEFGVQKWPIRVNSVHPGGVETPMMFGIMDRYVELGAVPSIEAAQAGVVTSHPIGRLGLPEEIAAGVVFLCSPGASFMTGSELVIDGGFSAR